MVKISLCLIVGNVENYIRRCLTSFKPIADEICVVRAIGCATPDKTLDIAREEFGAKCAEYKNRPGHEDWPHVDDFAAARQLSFDMASGEYCFWCDSDDVLESGADVARQLAEASEYAAYVFPYDIHGRGLMVPRERMVLRGSGDWKQPVHEHYDFKVKPVHAVEDRRVVVKHLPFAEKTGSNERNLRILRSLKEDELPTGLLYHYHVELALAGDIPKSSEVAKKVLMRPDLGKAEKYEVFLNLAHKSNDHRTKAALLHMAYAADPCRREALALLANEAMNTMRAEDALAHAAQMKATPRPKIIEWNDRAAIYGWVGDDIYSQALRLNGRPDLAEEIRRDIIAKAGGPKIALIHATRGRAEKAAMTRKIWLDQAAEPASVEHIFVFDSDDKDSLIMSRFHHVMIKPGGGCVAAWNAGAALSTAPVLVQMSDDWTPVSHWDRLILERLGDLSKPSVLAISDGVRNDDLLCMAICTRAYYELDWFLFHPGFLSVYSDNWFTEQAYARNAVIQAKDIVFQHHHPFFGKGEADATYAQQNSDERYKQGKQHIEHLRSGKDWSSIDGWFNYHGLYDLVAEEAADGDTVCEIGVWKGRSLTYLAQRLKKLGKRVKLIAVDTFKGEKDQPVHASAVAEAGGSIRSIFEQNLERCGVRDMVEILEGDSAEMASRVADASLAFCFVDAAHDYESVKRDIGAWSPKVKSGGWMAGHDAQWPDVKQAVVEAFPEAEFRGVLWCKKPIRK